MLTAPHTGIAWHFKLLSLSLSALAYPCPHAPPLLPPYQPTNLTLFPVVRILSPSLPPSPQEHLVFKLRLHLTSTLTYIIVLTENFLSGNSYNFPLCKFMARNKRALGDCCFNQHETCNQSGTHSLQLGIGLHLKIVVLIHNVVVLKERSTPAYLDGALLKCCGVISHKSWACELLLRLLVVAVVGRQDVVSSVVVQVVVGVVHHHIADVNNITPVSRCVVEDVVLWTEWNKKFGLL